MMDPLLILKSSLMLIAIIDPLGNIPIFLSLARGSDLTSRARTLNQAIIVAAILLVMFGILGKAIFWGLNLRLESFMIGGGILLLFIALDLIRGKEKEYGTEHTGAVPLGTPLLAGPGAITTSILIVEQWGIQTGLISIGIAILITKLILGASSKIYNFLGDAGTNILSRVMGVIIAAIAIEFIISGIMGYLS